MLVPGPALEQLPVNKAVPSLSLWGDPQTRATRGQLESPRSSGEKRQKPPVELPSKAARDCAQCHREPWPQPCPVAHVSPGCSHAPVTTEKHSEDNGFRTQGRAQGQPVFAGDRISSGTEEEVLEMDVGTAARPRECPSCHQLCASSIGTRSCCVAQAGPEHPG